MDCEPKQEDTAPTEADTDTDADADSDTDADSDADSDTDADTHPASELDCDNGLDDDDDGLVDCEDGDCAEAVGCMELICDDGLDDDDDGLVDCLDEDCWGPSCHPAGVRTRVHGGQLWARSYQRRTKTWHATTTAPWTAWDDQLERGAVAHSVWGTVRVLPSSTEAWGSSSARTTCTWTLANATTAWTFSYHGGSWRPVSPSITRDGLVVAPGCRLGSETWILPSSVHVAHGVGYMDNSFSAGIPNGPYGPRWYVGSQVDGTSWRTSTSWFRTSFHGDSSYQRYTRSTTWQIELGSTGSSWWAAP
jgi:hypothetical protein